MKVGWILINDERLWWGPAYGRCHVFRKGPRAFINENTFITLPYCTRLPGKVPPEGRISKGRASLDPDPWGGGQGEVESSGLAMPWSRLNSNISANCNRMVCEMAVRDV
jgi:hypothetical protein